MAPGLAGKALKDFVSHWMGWATAYFLWGAALGGIVFGWLGDKIGRVKSMNLSILFYSIFTGLSYFATQPWHLPASRFLAALGMGGEWALGVALVMEIWPEQKRPLLAGLIGAASNVGFAGIAIIAIQFPVVKESWRWVMLIGAAPALLTLIIRFFVPESDRWKEAVKNRTTHPLREIFTPPLLRRTMVAIVLASVVLIVTWGAVQWLALLGQERSLDPRAKAVTQALSAVGLSLGASSEPGWASLGGARRILRCASSRSASAFTCSDSRTIMIWSSASACSSPALSPPLFTDGSRSIFPSFFPPASAPRRRGSALILAGSWPASALCR